LILNWTKLAWDFKLPLQTQPGNFLRNKHVRLTNLQQIECGNIGQLSDKWWKFCDEVTMQLWHVEKAADAVHNMLGCH